MSTIKMKSSRSESRMKSTISVNEAASSENREQSTVSVNQATPSDARMNSTATVNQASPSKSTFSVNQASPSGVKSTFSVNQASPSGMKSTFSVNQASPTQNNMKSTATVNKENRINSTATVNQGNKMKSTGTVNQENRIKSTFSVNQPSTSRNKMKSTFSVNNANDPESSDAEYLNRGASGVSANKGETTRNQSTEESNKKGNTSAEDYQTPNQSALSGEVANKILGFNSKELTLNSGPFHYQIRASTYGDLYDEIPWRVKMGLDCDKDRSIFDRSATIGKYSPEVLVSTWNEERRDRTYVKNRRPPPISQYGHTFLTTYGTTIGNKRVCNVDRAVVQYMKGFNIGAVPAHQPELDVAMHRCCVPKPQVCLEQDCRDCCRQEYAVQRRIARMNNPRRIF